MAPSEIPDDVLSACAAGELPSAEAEAVRVRAASDPALAARLATAARVERALRADDFLPVPLALLSTVIEHVRAEPALAMAPSGDVAARVPVPERTPVAVRRTPAAVRRFGAIAAALLVSLGLWATTSGYEPAGALGLPSASAGTSLPESLGSAVRPADARTYNVSDAWADFAPAPASTPVPSILWMAGGLGLLAAAGVLARRFRPLFEAAAISRQAASPRTA